MNAQNATVERLARGLAESAPRLAAPPSEPRNRASVAIVVHPEATGLEILFIERARRAGDYWSGDVAFPGGRFEPGDADAEATARRETREELGIELPAPLGRLDDFDSRVARRDFELVVSPFVYAVEHRPPLAPSLEVASAAWLPLSRLLAADARAEHHRLAGRSAAARVRHSALRCEDYLIWGMTYRMLASLVARLGERLPD